MNGLEGLFESKVDIPRIKVGNKQSIEILINEEALLFAKYLIVFNYPQINPYGALTEEHFTAMKTFWNKIHTFPGNASEKTDAQVALVLPKDYGWGMRDGYDNIWGF